MNKIVATISEIEKLESLHIVRFQFASYLLEMMSLELSEEIKVGQKVVLGVKPTQISFAKNLDGKISISNQIRAKIKEINNGKLLSSAIFETNNTLIESVFTTKSLRAMNLQLHDEFTILIKASDISILEMKND